MNLCMHVKISETISPQLFILIFDVAVALLTRSNEADAPAFCDPQSTTTRNQTEKVNDYKR
jgi:hypothetical protein